MKRIVTMLSILVLMLGLLLPVSSVSATRPTGADQAASRVSGTTLIKYEGIWYYVKNGHILSGFTGLYPFNGSWYYIRNGQVDTKTTTLVKYNGSWYYVANGKVNFRFTGLFKFSGSWYYVKDGKVASGSTTLVKHGGSWYYVEKGKVNFQKTTLCKYGNDWYLVKNGTTQPKTTTLFKFNGSWYYIKNGKVCRTTVFYTFNNQKYYIKNGVAQTGQSGAIVYNGSTYYLKNGALTTCHTQGHIYTQATYLYPATCKRCTLTNGSALVPKTKAEKNDMAHEVAMLLVAEIPEGTDLERISTAAYIVSVFASYGRYTMEGEDYSQPYGVFVKGEYSCAGCTRALGMLLECMGYEWTHINAHQYTHQWCVVEMDGKIGWADGQIGMAGYGEFPFA